MSSMESTKSSASRMRRWCCAIQLLGWRQLRFSGTQEVEARIRQEVNKAVVRLVSGNSLGWVAVSRVSSLLSDDTRETLAELGGLAQFCRLQQGRGDAQFAVAMMDDVPCLRMKNKNNSSNKEKKGPVKHSVEVKGRDNPATEFGLRQICKVMPDKPVTLDACRRCWKLPEMSAAVEHVTLLLRQLDDILRRHQIKCGIPMYLQVGYYGKQPAFVACGPKAASVKDECTNAGDGDGDVPQWLEGDFAPLYDLWRMSRFLSTDRFTSVDEVKMQTSGILQAPLLQVGMTYRERIDLQLGPAMDIETAVDGRLYVNGATSTQVHEVVGLKFRLSEEEVLKHLRSSSKLTGLSDEQLFEERVKLKELPPLRRQKLRRSLVREEFRRCYPNGNVFLNPNVVAFHVYDLMAPGVWFNNSTVRETMLPDGGKGSMHVGVDFFDQFPDLFITQGITTTSVNVMRREQAMEDVQSDEEIWKSGTFRDEDILLSLLPRLCSKKEDWGEKSLGVLVTLLPRHVFRHMRRQGNAGERLGNILRRYPEAFELVKRDKNDKHKRDSCVVRLHYDGIEKLGARLANELHAAEDKSGLAQGKKNNAVAGSDG